MQAAHIDGYGEWLDSGDSAVQDDDSDVVFS